jgi:curved DNA-binding protein CbpA
LKEDKVLEYCKVLGLNGIPNPENLKTVYRKLIFKWHPDRHAKDNSECEYATKKAQQINESYEFLSELLEKKSSNVLSDKDFEQYSKNYKTQHTYKKQNFNPGFSDPHVIEVFLKSTAIISAGYDKSSKTFYVKFTSGPSYKYFDFPESLYNQFIDATSHGRFLSANVIRKFEYERLD